MVQQPVSIVCPAQELHAFACHKLLCKHRNDSQIFAEAPNPNPSIRNQNNWSLSCPATTAETSVWTDSRVRLLTAGWVRMVQGLSTFRPKSQIFVFDKSSTNQHSALQQHFTSQQQDTAGIYALTFWFDTLNTVNFANIASILSFGFALIKKRIWMLPPQL